MMDVFRKIYRSAADRRLRTQYWAVFGATVMVAGLAWMPAIARAGEFGIVPGSLTVSAQAADGSQVTQASAHPYELTIHFRLRTDEQTGLTEGGQMRDLILDLPPGLVGDPLAVPRCARTSFEGSEPRCEPNTQVGVVRANISLGEVRPPLYNLFPTPGAAAQFGFNAAEFFGLPMASASQEEGYAVRIATDSLPIEATEVTATVWGVPADKSHQPERKFSGGPRYGAPAGAPEAAFLTLPAECGKPLRITVYADSQLNPGNFVTETAESRYPGGAPADLGGCESVPFAPRIATRASSSRASDASGLDFTVGLPNEGLTNPSGVAETEPQKVEVTLPSGFTANPSISAGLTACSEEQFKAASIGSAGCPESSKFGTLMAHSPLIEEPVEGSVYLATPLDNRFGTLLSLYLVASAPERGVLIKQAGRVDIDQTGQLTTTFEGLPPLPYSSFELNLREGPRAPLTTPLTCGTFQTTARLSPFSQPTVATSRTAPITISSGPEGGGCVVSEAELPNTPTFEAGTQTPLAGLYSPFVLKLSRGEASQHFQALNVTLPEGLTGRLASTAECSNAQVLQAASRSREGEGALEQASPSCPASSEIGTVTVGAGSGAPLYVQGHAYLAGPYKGAPLSMVIVTPAIAGPFDLGTVVVRAALFVNEETAQISVKSDPIPTMLHGIPLDVRSIAVNVSKNQFTLNPTSCEVASLGAEEVSTTGSVAQLSNRFQVGGCRGLEFHPQVSIRLNGPTKRAGHPSLKAVVSFPHKVEEANTASIQVGLPKSLFLDQGNLNKVCKRAELAAHNCPSTSVYGHVKAYTPLFDEPLTGSVYLGVGFGYKLPALVTELNGKVRILAHGRVDTTKQKGLRNTFEFVPDAPLSRIVLDLKGGKKYGLLENSENLCAEPQTANARLAAHNGAVAQLHPRIVVQCGKKSKKKKRPLSQ
jgi:hypothetical protein